MRKFIAGLLAVIMSICAVGCKGNAGYIRFHDEVFKRADLSPETVEWLEWYNELTEEEQLAISYIPGEIHSMLFSDAPHKAEEAVEANS
ncbi:MAG: hypothetical protein IJN83_03840 [Clostridia bacterium]|nr:hypothetical protein [Clostridia bacterium]